LCLEERGVNEHHDSISDENFIDAFETRTTHWIGRCSTMLGISGSPVCTSIPGHSTMPPQPRTGIRASAQSLGATAKLHNMIALAPMEIIDKRMAVAGERAE
jgi:hypothetical protein